MKVTQDYTSKPHFIGCLSILVGLSPAINFKPLLTFKYIDKSPNVRMITYSCIEQSMPSLLYFERTYIGRTLPGGFHQEPLFPIQMWNQHHEVTQGIPRTSNAVEAWHRLFNATVGCYHPNIWRFIDVFKREQWLVEVKQAKFIAGDKPTKHRKTTSMKWGLEV